MLSSVLNSERAIHVNIAIMRAFVRLREMLASHRELATKLEQLEKRIENHDEQIVAIQRNVDLLARWHQIESFETCLQEGLDGNQGKR